MEYNFCGWATKNNLLCSDGRTIIKDAFKDCDGKTVPLVWNHQHADSDNVLGHALLENRDEGVYAYCSFNDTPKAKNAQNMVEHGDITSLSIYANRLKQQGTNVLHGSIREVSLVLAGANPGAFIEDVIKHGEYTDDECVIFTGEDISFYDSVSHSDDTLNHKDEEDKTVAEVLETFTEEQKKVLYALVGSFIQDEESSEDDKEIEHSEGGDNIMKHNVFDQATNNQNGATLSHADEMAIVSLAKETGVSSLKKAFEIYESQNGSESLKHAFENITALFPEYKDVKPGAPEILSRDQGWVGKVMSGVHKSPISRIRTRQTDARSMVNRANGYEKGDKKTTTSKLKLLSRTTDPQTIYRVDSLHRDDIIDIVDFDVVAYQYGVMKENLIEEIATAIMVGDGREEVDEHKISEDHIRPIWKDDDLYTIKVQTSSADILNTSGSTSNTDRFGKHYRVSEVMVEKILYAREKYKGTGTPALYCTPRLLNIMLLARDMNGRRLYDSKDDLARALNVTDIITAEQFVGLQRESDGNTYNLLGIIVNIADYQLGAAKGGELTTFEDFDIDFNTYKYLIETRLSGALTRPYSAIAIEDDNTSPLVDVTLLSNQVTPING